MQLAELPHGVFVLRLNFLQLVREVRFLGLQDDAQLLLFILDLLDEFFGMCDFFKVLDLLVGNFLMEMMQLLLGPQFIRNLVVKEVEMGLVTLSIETGVNIR